MSPFDLLPALAALAATLAGPAGSAAMLLLSHWRTRRRANGT